MMHDWFWGGGWHFPFFGFGPLLFILLIGAMIYWLFRSRSGNEPPQDMRETPRQILERRYAAGEINREQFEQMKRDLSS
jgi:putative membrane protein